MNSNPRRAIRLYLLFTFALSAIVYVLTIHAKDQGRIAGRIYGYGIMWCPALATLITCRVLGRDFRSLGWHWPRAKDQLLCYLIPIAYALIAYVIIWLAGWGGFYNTAFVTQAARELGWTGLPTGVFIVAFFVVEGVIGLIGSMSTALGEEIGWRGFLVPELSKVTSYTKTSLISGIVWSVWHYPILIWGNYNNGTPAWYGMLCFTVMVISMSFIYTWFRLRSGSLWTGVMLHASHNLFIQVFFTPITLASVKTKWYSDEFGAVVPAVTLCFAIYFWSRCGSLQPLSVPGNTAPGV